MRRRVERLKEQGFTDADVARIHAPIGLAIGAVSPAEIAVAIMGEITARLRRGPREPAHEVRAGARRARPTARSPSTRSARRGMVLKKGTLIGADRDRRAGGRGHRRDRRGAARAGRRVARTTRPPRSPRRSRARACASTAPSPAAPICSPRQAGVLVVDKDAIDALNHVDEAITFATLAGLHAGGRRRDDRDGEDHSVRGRRRGARRGARGSARRKAARARRALQGPQGRHHLDAAAGPRRQGDREDAAGHRGAARARPAPRSSPSGACRTSRARWRRRSTRCWREGAELVVVFGASAIADRRDVIPAAVEAVGGRIEHFGMPVDPGNLLLVADATATAGARRAGLRALAEGERLRLGADAAARRPAGDARRHHRLRRRRPADGDRDAAAAARRNPQPETGAIGRGRGARRRPLDPHGRAEQAAGRDRRQAAGAHRRRAGARLARAAGDRRHRPSARAGRAALAGLAGAVRAQSGFRRRPVDLAQGRHRRGAGRRSTARSSASATCRR